MVYGAAGQTKDDVMTAAGSHSQMSFKYHGDSTAGEALERIRAESRDTSEKGRWFELLFMQVAKQDPALEIDGIWRWPEWPEREAVTGLDGRDFGIDLVARRITGEWVAIQCKCYADTHNLVKDDINKFLGGSQHRAFEMRWVVTTCKWGPNARRAIEGASPQVGQIDFHRYLDVEIESKDVDRPIQEPWELQDLAIEDVVTGLGNHDRGRLIMACGTGKTFTSLRIAERIVDDGGRVLFVAPSIALVSQARREWLRQTTRSLHCIVVCSDSTAGGRNESEDIGISELECPVSTGPAVIADKLTGGDPALTRVVFCTYHSLRQVTDAQAHHGAPAFDLVIADEAHRTTGVRQAATAARKVDFQELHDNERLHVSKRLYMTATPRLYTSRSKSKLAERGIDVVDMDDYDVYGPELHRLTFKKAVEANKLSDYRVIVLGVNEDSVTPRLHRRLAALSTSSKQKDVPTTSDMTRVLGVLLAVNGVTEGTALEQPGKLQRTMAFANTIARSKWYARALLESEVLRRTTRRMQDGRAMKVVANHLDASASAYERNQELRALATADREDECRLVCNVRLFTEGVDVPQLDAVAFLDPRDSQVDVVQAVGRVMRKAEGKRFGYIIVPVVVEPGQDVADALQRNTEGYKTVGRVLRALQAHDGRLAESPARFVKVYEQDAPPPEGNGGGHDSDDNIQYRLNLNEAEQGIYAHVAAASGLGKPGQLVADQIADVVRHAGRVFHAEKVRQAEPSEDPCSKLLGEVLGEVLDIPTEKDENKKAACVIAALMLCNACLLQRRLNDVPELETERLDKVAGALNPKEPLEAAWELILERDYAPVFQPALAVLQALPDGSKEIDSAVRNLAARANQVADSLSGLGYDHAGPLYHRILDSAKSDGAFYTNNLSAIMLARLAFDSSFADWSNTETVRQLRIMDPACGTGTLLMATLRTIKAHVAEHGDVSDEDSDTLHKRLVEEVLCGLDINGHGVQLAACNMTLGAPTVDYSRMNLVTMPHGPQSDGTVRAGSLEVLTRPGDEDLRLMFERERSINTLDGTQVDASAEVHFPLRNLDGIIMNAPFTDNRKRGRKFDDPQALKAMQQHEIAIRDLLEKRDPSAGRVITSNSIRTFFTPLADQLISSDRGVLAKVVPTTACTGPSGVAERQFLAERFHVERVVTTHDPRRIAFSENTSIHESLLICRRHAGEVRPATEFVSLRQMPSNVEEANAVADAITSGHAGDWGRVCTWPASRLRSGDWTPVQWYDGALADVVHALEANTLLQPISHRFEIGPDGRSVQDAYEVGDRDMPDAVPGFHSASGQLRQTMRGDADVWYVPRRRPRRNMNRWIVQNLPRRSHLLVTMRFNTVSGRLTGLWTSRPSFGWWAPVAVGDEDTAKALAVWWNTTPVRLMLLNRRAQLLTYPTWQLAHLREICIPTENNPAWALLRTTFDQVCEQELLPMRQAEECVVREVIDEVAAIAIGVGPDVLADWRRRLAVEPTISNTPAPIDVL